MRPGYAVLLLAMMGCGSTEPTLLDTLEPGRYILSSFDGKRPPFSLIERTYPEFQYVEGIELDTVYIESASVFRRVFKTFANKRYPDGFVETYGAAGSYSGTILERDGAFLLVMNEVPYVLPLEIRAYPDVLFRRLSLQVYSCSDTGADSCEVVRQGLLDASYVRR
ncbi:MAG TPA: hypothetical protein VJU15_09845 [Gemmatimonadales bacterium]|nr:hypothetical protein [Gemmatimonadales bacterium]